MNDQDAIRMKERIESIWRVADSVGRPVTHDEQREIDHLLSALERRKAMQYGRTRLDGSSFERGLGGANFGGPGDEFVKSAGYLKVKDAGGRPQKFTTGLVEVSTAPLSAKGTLLESNTGGPGGGLVPPM